MLTAFTDETFDDEALDNAGFEYTDDDTQEIEIDFFYSIDLETERLFLGYAAPETPQQKAYRLATAG